MIYSEDNLRDEKFFKKVQAQAQEMMLYDQIHEASKLRTSLEQSLDLAKGFEERNYDLYIEYKKIIIKLKWLILPVLKNEKVVDLFRQHFTTIYNIPDYDFWRKLRAVLLGFLVFDSRDNYKKAIRQALLENQERLTSKKMLINNQEKVPTVGNWILDYNSNLGTGPVDKIKRVQYYINNQNIKLLNDQERGKVKTLLDIYERLKLSSHTLEGLEEDIPVDEPGKEGIIRGGVFEPYKEDEKWKWLDEALAQYNNKSPLVVKDDNLAELKQLALKYPAGSFERKAVEEEIRKNEV